MSAIEPSAPRPKPAKRKRKGNNRPRRIIDPRAVKDAMLSPVNRECAACGGQATNGDHVLPKDKGGDDVAENIVGLCGTGTSGCHGAKHGSPYTVRDAMILNGPRSTTGYERRDATWVNHRVGKTLIERRPDVINYVLGKLGDVPGRDYLERVHAIRLDDDGVWRQAPAAAPRRPPPEPGTLRVIVG